MSIIAEKINLSEDQQTALDFITEWIESGTTNQMSLIGYAGTGKTFLVSEIIKYIVRNTRLSVCICAPTHKAKEVLSSKCVGTDAYTSAGLIGLAPDETLENFDPNRPDFLPKFESKIGEYDIIIHDESSMLSPTYHSYLMDKCVDCGTRVLFVGDDAQLPPVMSPDEVKKQTLIYGETLRDSPSLLCDDKAVLSQVIRQKEGNPLGYLLLALRLDIDFYRGRIRDGKVWDSFCAILPEQYKNILEGLTSGRTLHRIIANIGQDLNSKQQGFIFIRQPNEFQNALTHLTDEIRDGLASKAVAFTNKRVKELNSRIRNGLVEPNSPIIIPNEMVMGYRTINDANNVPIITNSKEYKILRVKEPYEDLHGYKVFDIATENRGGIVILHPDSYTRYISEYRTRLKNAKTPGKRAWPAFYAFRNSYILFDDLSVLWDDKTLPRKDLDYAYAITTHKSQGSTYETVLVDVNDMLAMIQINHGDKTDFYRMLYVAASRASKQVIFFIK